MAIGTAIVAVMAPAVAAASAAEDLQAGVAAWKAGDHARAVALWRPLATAGVADAQFNLGQAYRLGRGVPADPRAARDWYLKAAQQNHAQAQANYGLLLYEDGDRAGAMPWLQKAADRGDPRAQYVVGTVLFNGDPPPRDWVRAYALMTRAAAASLPQAVASLAEMDRYIPLDQRQQGIALAREMGRGATAAKPLPAAAPPTASPRTAATPASSPASGKAKGRGWRVQLGAFGDADRAERLWRQISAADASLADKQHYVVKAGSVTRLQAGPFGSSAAAEQACAAIRRQDHPCFAVREP
ncbi:Sel1 repeat-containing protein [Sphingomonas laterariae]|uniref:Sel1 repeat-containing protein n=1 Tax=Edaphosphingomonas laterariae TaxID=861865 RepID=A0A239EHZ3_9SPHN|nr:SPOR domain-containing protein [Sphingomonas laterariae]SNS43898.1 Sel1 repeat-containing protein [Sphingomonas laterariae]